LISFSLLLDFHPFDPSAQKIARRSSIPANMSFGGGGSGGFSFGANNSNNQSTGFGGFGGNTNTNTGETL
jgi:hypothetical protein